MQDQEVLVKVASSFKHHVSVSVRSALSFR